MTTLGTYPHDFLRIVCSKCPRMGRYRRERLVQQLGPDFRLVDVLWRLTATCPLRDTRVRGGVYCGAYFLED